MRIVRYRAPTRIDLGGGTLDIFPLYHLHAPVITTNLAISLHTSSMISAREDTWLIESTDMGISHQCSTLQNCMHHDLDLLIRVLKQFSPTPVRVETHSMAPQGSGLGASSSLLCTAIACLTNHLGKPISDEALIQLAQHIETQHLEMPTGIQDYYPAVHGGMNKLEFSSKGMHHTRLQLGEKFTRELESHIILCNTGIAHQSGTDNWNTLKNRIEHPNRYRSLWQEIAEYSLEISSAIEREDLASLVELTNEEWMVRQKVHPAIFNSKMKTIVADISELTIGMKGCGAGNGGVMILFVEPQDQNEVTQRLVESSAQVLPWQIDRKGLSKI